MPSSAEEGRPWMASRLKALNPLTVVDVGVGCGTYSDLLRPLLPDVHLTGIEVWEPYVARYALTTKYDRLVLGDARQWDIPPVDVVILGDVLEHMTEDEALQVWARARDAARLAVYLSIPIHHYPQGAEEGNPYEVHVEDDYSHQRVLDTFPGITASWTGTVVGVYEAAVV